MTEAIKILITGGTFDKEYNEIAQKLVFTQTHVPAVLKEGRCQARVDVVTIMLKDSLEMTDADREVLSQYVARLGEKRVVITHGTDTMPETARYLSKRIKGKTIVLTGAMVPYAFGSSDGLFNLGAALAFVQSLPEGVFVAMNGRWFSAESVRKNLQTGFFESRD